MRVVDGPSEGARAVVVTHLQMLDPIDLRPSTCPPDTTLVRATGDKSDTSRSFYTSVGSAWHWVDRLSWTSDQWSAWTDRDEHHLFTLVIDSQSADSRQAGYVELEQQPGGDVEIAYLGLLPGFSGGGRGGWLLTRALEEAWALPGTRRVWVHTCDLDSPAALTNYRARGMQEFHRTIEWRVSAPDTVAP